MEGAEGIPGIDGGRGGATLVRSLYPGGIWNIEGFGSGIAWFLHLQICVPKSPLVWVNTGR